MDLITIGYLASFFVILFMGVPIAYCMLLIGFFGMVHAIGFFPSIASTKALLFYSISNWLFVCVPLFILMGLFASLSGVVEDIFKYFNIWFRKLAGALALVTIATAAMFAFATGSSAASTAVLGNITLSQMDKYKYSRNLSLGSIVAGGSLGNLIPPSIGLVVYSIITEQPIGHVLIAAILPGLLVVAFFMMTVMLRVKLDPTLAPKITEVAVRYSWWAGIKKVGGLLTIIILVLGSIFFGVATPTEAASVGAFGSFLIVILRRKFSWMEFWKALDDTMRTTGMLFLIIIGVSLFSRYLTLSGFSRTLANFVVASSVLSPPIVLTLMILILTICGCIMDPGSMLLIFTPIFFPIIVKLGYDPIWFGVFMVAMVEIGFMTPPVGLCLFVLQGVSDASMEEIVRSVLPFFGGWYACILLICIFPDIALFLPKLMIGG